LVQRNTRFYLKIAQPRRPELATKLLAAEADQAKQT
jgi:hypothetical protein